MLLLYRTQLGNHWQYEKKRNLGLKDLFSRAHPATYCHLKGKLFNFSELSFLSVNRVIQWHSDSYIGLLQRSDRITDSITFTNSCVSRCILKVITA